MKMYRLKQNENKYVTTCNSCHNRGYVKSDCNECGGKGIRFKNTDKWIIKEIEICNIDRDSEGELRYWTDLSCFYKECNKLIHPTIKDAEQECIKRNTIFSKVKNLSIINSRKY